MTPSNGRPRPFLHAKPQVYRPNYLGGWCAESRLVRQCVRRFGAVEDDSETVRFNLFCVS